MAATCVDNLQPLGASTGRGVEADKVEGVIKSFSARWQTGNSSSNSRKAVPVRLVTTKTVHGEENSGAKRQSGTNLVRFPRVACFFVQEKTWVSGWQRRVGRRRRRQRRNLPKKRKLRLLQFWWPSVARSRRRWSQRQKLGFLGTFKKVELLGNLKSWDFQKLKKLGFSGSFTSQSLVAGVEGLGRLSWYVSWWFCL